MSHAQHRQAISFWNRFSKLCALINASCYYLAVVLFIDDFHRAFYLLSSAAAPALLPSSSRPTLLRHGCVTAHQRWARREQADDTEHRGGGVHEARAQVSERLSVVASRSGEMRYKPHCFFTRRPMERDGSASSVPPIPSLPIRLMVEVSEGMGWCLRGRRCALSWGEAPMSHTWL